jgi:hypothetical protein
MSSLTRGIQNPISQEPCKEAETDSRAEFSKESVAGYRDGQNGSHIIVRRPTQACSGCSGPAPACSPSAQVKAAVAHVHRLKRTSEREN